MDHASEGKTSFIMVLGFLISVTSIPSWTAQQPAASAQDTHTKNADASVARRELAGHVPRLAIGLTPIGHVSPTTVLELGLVLQWRNPDILAEKLKQVYDPKSSEFRNFLTPAQFEENFGPTTESYEAIISFARASGLEITRTSADRVSVHVKGTVSAIEKAFHLQLLLYKHPITNETVFAPDRDPSIDPTLKIIRIEGLSNFPRRWPNPRIKIKVKSAEGLAENRRTPGNNASTPAQDAPSGPFGGNDFRSAYAPDVSKGGAGQTVAVVAFDGYLASDISTYETNGGLPAMPLQNLFFDGLSSPTKNIDCSTDTGFAEVALDIENVIAMAPNLTQVTVYGVPGASNERDVLDEIAAPTQGEPFPRQITTSWLFNYETDGSTYEALERLALQGQAFFSASGDYGAYTPYTPKTPSIVTAPFTPVDDWYVTGVASVNLIWPLLIFSFGPTLW